MSKNLRNGIARYVSFTLALVFTAGCGTTIVEDVLRETLKERPVVAVSQTEVKTLSEYIEDENYESAKWLLDDLYKVYPTNPDTEAEFSRAMWNAARELQFSHDEKLQAFIARYQGDLSVDFFAAVYLFHKGAKIRGDDYINKTSKAKLDGMKVEMEKSVAAFEKILERHPESYLAHAYIGKNYSYIAPRKQSDIAFRKSLVQKPASFAAWNGFLWYNRPRWGGNYAGMMRLINEMGYEVRDNPRLASLRGVILADKASLAIDTGKYDDAETLIMQAMDYGEVNHYTRVADNLHAKLQASGDFEGACRISQKVYRLQRHNQRYKNLVAVC